MLCRRCGAETPRFLKYCTHCGGHTQQEAPLVQSASVKELEQAQPWVIGDPNDTMRSTPLKWHRFFSGFGLYFAAFCLTALAVLSVSGFVHGAEAKQIYKDYPGIGTADTVYGMLLLCSAVLSALTASALKQNRKAGLKLLMLLYLLLFIVTQGYVLWSLSLSDAGMLGKQLPQSAAVFGPAFLSLIPNWVYYRKRVHIFIFD